MRTLPPLNNINRPLQLPSDGEPVILTIDNGKRKFQIRTSQGVLELLRQAGITNVLPPVSVQTSFTNSRIIAIPLGDGKVDLQSLLSFLGTMKYVTWDPKTHTPHWIDMDWRNETLDNVHLVEVRKGPASPTRRRSQFGVASGTPEYHRRYREANLEKHKQYQREYQKRVREKRKNDMGVPFTTTVAQNRAASGLEDIIRELSGDNNNDDK